MKSNTNQTQQAEHSLKSWEILVNFVKGWILSRLGHDSIDSLLTIMGTFTGFAFEGIGCAFNVDRTDKAGQTRDQNKHTKKRKN
jgi:hypothetical protein